MRKRCKEDRGGELGIVRQLISSRRATPAVLGVIAATRAGRKARREEYNKKGRGTRPRAWRETQYKGTRKRKWRRCEMTKREEKCDEEDHD